jgi:16S rRNA C967 or C1407 C5-methylase (RsmB/RsmF family)
MGSVMNENFKPINCRRCGAVVWEGVSWAGFTKRLDKKTLTVEEEIVAILNGRKTYEAHRTAVSFEAVERCLIRIKAGRKKHIHILADHICSGTVLFDTEIPNYWEKPERKVNDLSNLQAPF